MVDAFDEIFGDKKKVLVIMGHPDDCEIICGGTVARLTGSGRKVRLVVATTGGKGFKDRKDTSESKFAKLRTVEQVKAGLELGIAKEDNFNLQIPDGELETTVENIGKIVYHIREFKPDIIITHHPVKLIVDFSENSHWVNHRDHRSTGIITLDAIYPYSRDRGFFPEHFEKGLSPHEVHAVLFSDSYNDKNVRYFNIEKYLEQKRKALSCHKNAFGKEEVEDLISETKSADGYFEPLGFLTLY
jgi:LmbE family N-acetylglucosaminyl deacetylase